MTFFGCNALKSVSMNNQEFKITSGIKDVYRNEPLFYLYIVKINKCSGICNNINDPYAKLCVKNINIKVFNLISRTNKTSI